MRPWPKTVAPPGRGRVAVDSMSCLTRSADSAGVAAMMSAASADAYGVAIDVPLASAYAVGDEPHSETMPTPGADTSR